MFIFILNLIINNMKKQINIDYIEQHVKAIKLFTTMSDKTRIKDENVIIYNYFVLTYYIKNNLRFNHE